MSDDPKAPAEYDPQPMETYKKVLALIGVALVVAAGVVWHARISPDLWPPDSSRVGPNLVAAVLQAVVVVFVAALVWPPTRKRMHRFVDRKLAPVHEHLAVIREHHEQAAVERAEIKHALHHVIRSHPDIPLMEGMEPRPTDRVPAKPPAPKPAAKPVPTKTKKAAPKKKAAQ